MSENQPCILSIHERGMVEYPRWCIADSLGRVFDGTGWVNAESSALIYADLNAACHDLQTLQRLAFQSKRVRRYREPVVVEIFSDQNLSLDQIRAWLLRVSRLVIDSPIHGLGPAPNTLGLVRIEWSELKEKK